MHLDLDCSIESMVNLPLTGTSDMATFVHFIFIVKSRYFGGNGCRGLNPTLHFAVGHHTGIKT